MLIGHVTWQSRLPLNNPNIIIGGGNGTSTLLKGIDADAIVNPFDDGGHSGELRQQYPGLIGVGDARQCLLATARNHDAAKKLSRRNETNQSAGNIAIAEMTYSFGGPQYIQAAIDDVQEYLGSTSRVMPSSLTAADMVLDLCGRPIMIGEYNIAHSPYKIGQFGGFVLRLSDNVPVNPTTELAIREAEKIVIAPGNLYGSVVPALMPEGMVETIKDSGVPVIMVTNACNTTQTEGFTTDDYADELERHTGLVPDVLVAHNGNHVDEKSRVIASENSRYETIYEDVLTKEVPTYDPNDKIASVRSRYRHNAKLIGELIGVSSFLLSPR